MNMTKTQLELTFEAPTMRIGRMEQRNGRLARARWWFDQMHEVVDRAFDWSTAPAPPPEQTCLTLVKVQ
jgi:hypothetical protein